MLVFSRTVDVSDGPYGPITSRDGKRKSQFTIAVGDQKIVIRLLKLEGRKVRVGVDAPKEFVVSREDQDEKNPKG